MSDLFLILTTAQADAVRGETSPGAWLAPVPLADGEIHILPERVLWDPEHAAAWPRLESLPRANLLPTDLPAGA
ncbi:hypothetical protein J5J86_10930 [Aquabacter sp. L1I39]|uniref:hypothetical protein n=1 Tax=Aquabacter sp. L1I39 TaxID=2820278 RepID=UPI001ADB78D0|nr:hypothetical protein [Aquabacter sp. L1I39]QTL05754.1 hypothetical protein J5J86_10930 [Aquabacter sp. L1I39]